MRGKTKVATFMGIIFGVCLWLGGSVGCWVYASILCSVKETLGFGIPFIILGVFGIALTILSVYFGIIQYKKLNAFEKDARIAIVNMFLLGIIPGVMYFCWDPEVDKQLIYVNENLVKISEKLDKFNKTNTNNDDFKTKEDETSYKKENIQATINNNIKNNDDIVDNLNESENVISNDDIEIHKDDFDDNKETNLEDEETYDSIKDIVYDDEEIEKKNKYYKSLVKSGIISVKTYKEKMKQFN